MAYRFNFTGRKRVLEAEAKIHVEKDAKPLKVRLEQTFSTRNLYGADDIVMLEAIRRTKLRRCNLGTVGGLQQNTRADGLYLQDTGRAFRALQRRGLLDQRHLG